MIKYVLLKHKNFLSLNKPLYVDMFNMFVWIFCIWKYRVQVCSSMIFKYVFVHTSKHMFKKLYFIRHELDVSGPKTIANTTDCLLQKIVLFKKSNLYDVVSSRRRHCGYSFLHIYLQYDLNDIKRSFKSS